MSPTCTAKTWQLSGHQTCWGEILSVECILQCRWRNQKRNWAIIRAIHAIKKLLHMFMTVNVINIFSASSYHPCLRSKQIESACFSGTAAFMEVRIQSVVVEFILNNVDVLFSAKLSSLIREGAGESTHNEIIIKNRGIKNFSSLCKRGVPFSLQTLCR